MSAYIRISLWERAVETSGTIFYRLWSHLKNSGTVYEKILLTLATWIVGYINVSKVFSPSVAADVSEDLFSSFFFLLRNLRSNNEHLLAILVLLDSWVISNSTSEVSKRSVGMTSHNQLQASGCFSQLLIFLISDVGDGSNTGDVGSSLYQVDCVLNRSNLLSLLAWMLITFKT